MNKRTLIPRTLIDIEGKLIYNEGFQAWNTIRLKKEIFSEFPELKEKRSKFSSKNEQVMINSPQGIQQQSQKIINYFGHESKEIDSLMNEKIKRISIREEEALKEIYQKMVKVLREVNRVGNVGIKNKEEYREISGYVEEFISAKMDKEIEIDEEIKSKFDEVMRAFRYTLHELYILTTKKKFDEGVKGIKAFDFIKECKEATTMIKQRLRGD